MRPQSAVIDHLALRREALIDELKHSLSLTRSGLGQEPLTGQGLLFTPRSQPGRLRSRELAWRRAHEDVLRRLAGDWVIVEGEELIAHGPDPVRLVADAKARGIQIPYVFFVEASGGDIVKMGL